MYAQYIIDLVCVNTAIGVFKLHMYGRQIRYYMPIWKLLFSKLQVSKVIFAAFLLQSPD